MNFSQEFLTQLHLNCYQGRHDHKGTVHVPICRRIWAMTLQLPKLWTTIQLNGGNMEAALEWLKICDERDRKQPLRMFLDLDRVKSMSHSMSTYQFRALMSRTSALCVQRDKIDLRGSLIDDDWPILEHLTILRSLMRSWDGVHCRIGSTLLGQSNSSLTSLNINCDTQIVNFPRLPKLRYLSLKAMSEFPSQYTAFRDLFEHARPHSHQYRLPAQLAHHIEPRR
jgi:hypothetical protein